MEKLSSILPKSPRTQNVDNSKAQPARPGAPLLGRPAGKVTQKVVFDDAVETDLPGRPGAVDLSFADKFSAGIPADKITLKESSLDEPKLSTYTRKGDFAKVKIAEDVGRKFAKIDVVPKTEMIPQEMESMGEESVSNLMEA